MATTKDEIQKWFERGVEQKATHMLIVCDTFDWEDYPVYIKADEDVRQVHTAKNANMQKVMEVYNLSMDMNKQLNQHRSFNY